MQFNDEDVASVGELEGELHDAWIAGCLNRAERATVQRRDGRVEVHLIQHVERFPSQLDGLRAGHFEGAHERKIVLQVPWVDDRERRGRAVGAGGGRRERGTIEARVGRLS
jgi:hypothetical protein